MRAASELDVVFAALADANRRAIVEQLTGGEATVGAVAAPLDMTLPSVSKHIKVLQRAGLVTRRVDGRRHWLRLAPEGFRGAADWFAHHHQFWSDSIDRLEALVAELETDTKGPP